MPSTAAAPQVQAPEAPAAPPLRVLSAHARPEAPFPRRAAWALAPLAGAGILRQLGWGGGAVFGLALAVGLVAALVLSSWLEERVYDGLRRRSRAPRAALAFALPLAAPLAALLAGILVEATLGWAGAKGWAIPVFIVAGLWFGGAAAGSAIVLVVESLSTRLLRTFRGRVMASLLALLVIALAVGAAANAAAIQLLEGARTDFAGGAIKLKASGDTGAAELAEWTRRILAHPVASGGVVFLTIALVALPSIVSASTKLGASLTDRLHPLLTAFDAVARGERRLHLEEGGLVELAALSRGFNQMVDALHLGERMERAFGAYVSAPLLSRIRAQHGEAALPPTLKEATVFFADIRGFTAFSERLSPDAVVALLNRYFGRVVALVEAHEGYLNKFIGDAVVVVWNGPVDQPRHAEQATRCALALQALVAELNAARAFPEIEALKVGVGVSTGPMLCGNIGSARQMEYTVIGDAVNLAARLTSKAGPGEIWVSAATAHALPPDLVAEALPPIQVKGKDEPVRPYRVTTQG